MKKYMLFTLTLIFIIGIVALFLAKQKLQSTKTNPLVTDIDSSTPSTINTVSKPSTTMTSFAESDLGFEIEYPSNWDLTKQGNYAYKIARKLRTPAAMETNYILIQVIPKMLNIADSEIYDFNRDSFAKLNSSINTKVNLSAEIPDMSDYFTYEKQQDVNIGSITAKVFINKKPWEFPGGTTEYKYIMETEDKYMILTAYLGTEPKDQFYIAKDAFQRILNTLALVTGDKLNTYGTISGKLCYPSQFLPEGNIQAKNIDTQQMFNLAYPGSDKGGKNEYAINVNPGKYILRYQAIIDKSEVYGYSTDVCPTGMETTCAAETTHKNTVTTVDIGTKSLNVNLCDFYYSKANEPNF